jgi:hypothetical protein
MAKSGFNINNISPILNRRNEDTTWALCVGAGISIPVFPIWQSLVNQLISLDRPGLDNQPLSKDLLELFSPDAIIQAAQDRLNKSDGEFAQILMTALYSESKNKLSSAEYDLFTRGLSSHSGDMTRSEWSKFLDIFRIHYPEMTALKIAKVINEVRGTRMAPSSILSFNAEPSFPALINAIYREGLPKVAPPTMKQASGKKILDLVTHSITSRSSTRLSVFFCHGLLPVPIKRSGPRSKQSVDKLVFSESEYLQLSNSAFSWQSNAFLDVCLSYSVVFLGVSLTDPDMRKWLSWVHHNRISEINRLYSNSGPSTNHFWIQKRPKDPDQMPWIESAVAHLGVRLVWIDDWSQADMALRKLIGV